MNHNISEGQSKGLFSSKQKQGEYSRILTAAVINTRFRSSLLSNPVKAVEAGYSGEVFHLAREEQKKISSIHAKTLSEFALQLYQ